MADSVAFQHGAGHTLIGYPLPSADGSTAVGSRRLGCALYDSSRDALLREKSAVVGSVVQHTLAAPDIPWQTFEELARDTRHAFTGEWRDAILDSIRRYAVIGTPVAEYVPDRLVRGRVALVGDAAHVANPMTGRGFAESLLDAESIGGAISSHTGEKNCSTALLRHELDRLETERELVRSGQLVRDESPKVARMFTEFRHANIWRCPPHTKCQCLEAVRAARQGRRKPINNCRRKAINSTVPYLQHHPSVVTLEIQDVSRSS